MAQMSNCTNTTDIICDGRLPNVNGTRIKYECSVKPFSTVLLPSCENGNVNHAIYWFWYDDVCSVSSYRNRFFAYVYPNNTFQCSNKPNFTINQDSCRNNYYFNRTLMGINITAIDSSLTYLCFTDITTSTTPDFSTTTLSSSSNSVGNNTITTDGIIGISGSVPPWAIAVPSVLGFLVIILLLILGYIYYRRRQRNKKPGSYTLETMSSRSDRSSNEEFDSTHGGYSSSHFWFGYYSTMNRWICFSVLIIAHGSQTIPGQKRIVNIIGTENNTEIPVWIHDQIEIVGKETVIDKWSFNNIVIAELSNLAIAYEYPNPSLLGNMNATFDISDSILNLGDVNRNYSGSYKAYEKGGNHSLTMVVYEVNVSSVEFNLIHQSGLCRGYIYVKDSLFPLISTLRRMVYSSELTLESHSQLNNNSVQINNSSITMTNNSINTDIMIQYYFNYNNYSTIRNYSAPLNFSLVGKPTVRKLGTVDNCTIVVEHNSNVECVRNIVLCLNATTDKEPCQTYNDTNNTMHILGDLSNFTFVHLSVVYDIIYTKYRFDIPFERCSIDVTTAVESSTMASSAEELTATHLYTTESMNSEATFNYSDSIYSSLSSSLFSTFFNTTTAKLIDSSEVPIINSSPAKTLAGWKIALIVIGSILGVLLLAVVIGLIIRRRNARKRSKSEISLGLRSSSNEQTIRPAIPPIRSIFTNISSREEIRRNQRQVPLPNYERSHDTSVSQSTSMYPNRMNQQRKLPPDLYE
ncbi:unnamed protein product [Rotaria socialis]